VIVQYSIIMGRLSIVLFTCFAILPMYGYETKILHKGRGKFKILNDEYGGKYSNKIVDASDVVRCKTEI
jgi:hypothetical protein